MRDRYDRGQLGEMESMTRDWETPLLDSPERSALKQPEREKATEEVLSLVPSFAPDFT